MRIISKGNKQTTCERCGCVMEYDANDVRRKTVEVGVSIWFDWMTKSAEREYINCPQCGLEITISQTCCK